MGTEVLMPVSNHVACASVVHFPGAAARSHCVFDCSHADCNVRREAVASSCRMCGAEIGYEREYVKDVVGRIHTGCLGSKCNASG